MKDNNQSANLAALVDAGIRSFKIEGRYKDMALCEEHHRPLPQAARRTDRGTRGDRHDPLARSSSGRTTFTFTPDPNQNFNREFTDYFVKVRGT